MFIDEAKLSSILQHPNIVQIYELGEIEGQYFIAMEYVHGKDLQKVMARANKININIPEDIALYFVEEICKALAYAYNARDHYGNPLKLIHRDISPSNVLISFEGDVKITDFGVAKAAFTRESGNILKGKLGYLSPEQVSGREVSHQSDIFSLGIILFEILTLKRLFLGKTDLQTLINIRDAEIEGRLKRHPEINPEIKEILKKALSKDIRDRYQNAMDFHGEIMDYLYKHNFKITPLRVSSFLKELFQTEADQDILPLSIEEVTGQREEEEVPEKPDDESGDIRVGRPEKTPDTRSLKIGDASFRLKKEDGGIWGPVSFENLLNLIKSRSLSETELCSINDGPWLPIKDIVSLKEHIFRIESEATKIPLLFEGTLEKKFIPRLVYEICAQKRLTGRLMIKQKIVRKEIYFKAGTPIHISSNIKKELFGEYLVNNGVIAREDLDKAISLSDQTGIKLGDSLIKLKLLKPHTLADLLQGQMKERFVDLFGLDGGWYGFFDGAVPQRDYAIGSIDPLATITEGVKTKFNETFLKSILHDYAKWPLEKINNKFISITQLKLSSKDLRIWSYLDSVATLDELLKRYGRTPQDSLQIHQMIFIFLQTELLRFKGQLKYYRI